MLQEIIAHCCPYCNSTNFRKHGTDRGIQRYRCKQCFKTYKDTTGTPLHWIHKKQLINKYIKCLQSGISIRKAARQTGICKNTSFTWRHKLLSSLPAQTVSNFPEEVISLKIITTAYSAKGRKKTPEKYREPSKTLQIGHSQQLQLIKLPPQQPAKHIAKTITQIKNAKITTIIKSKLLTSAFKHVGNKTEVIHKAQTTTQKQTSSRATMLLLNWMKRFRGVASKYLQQYWNWYSNLQNVKLFSKPTHHFLSLCIQRRSLGHYRALSAQ